MSAEKCVLVGQSGGPTAAINSSLAGVVSATRAAGLRSVGMRYGIQGFLDGRTVDLDAALPDERGATRDPADDFRLQALPANS